MIQHVTREVETAQLDACITFYEALGFQRVATPEPLAGRFVWLQLGPTMRALYGRVARHEPPRHHRLILAALKAGDEPGLRLAIRADVTQGLRHLIVAAGVEGPRQR